MKKIGLIITFVFLGWIVQLCAQIPPPYPIPSYNVPVNGTATFQETITDPNSPPAARGERVLIVRVKGSSSSLATIWVYSLDGQDRLGPFYAYGGETVSVPIDEREWGVIVQCEDPIEVDVWIEWEAKVVWKNNSVHNPSIDLTIQKLGKNNFD